MKKTQEQQPTVEEREKLHRILGNAGQAAFRAVLELLDPLSIADRCNIQPRPGSKYNAVMHAQLCRYKMLGLTDGNCARAIGIAPETLRSWYEMYPQLEIDMQQACNLITAEVAQMLFGLMDGKGPTAFDAVRFFLASRTEEFKERTEISVKTATPDELDTAVRNIYGVSLGGKPAESSELDAAVVALPVLPPPECVPADAGVPVSAVRPALEDI